MTEQESQPACGLDMYWCLVMTIECIADRERELVESDGRATTELAIFRHLEADARVTRDGRPEKWTASTAVGNEPPPEVAPRSCVLDSSIKPGLLS